MQSKSTMLYIFLEYHRILTQNRVDHARYRRWIEESVIANTSLTPGLQSNAAVINVDVKGMASNHDSSHP